MFPLPLPDHFLHQYGYAVVFGWVLVEQLGLPVPALPMLMAAGALTAEGDMQFGLALVAGLVASLVADTAWYWAGRRWGHRILGLMCRMSLEPTVCVRKTQDSYGRRRQLMLVFAKFVPGLATLAPPIAGLNGMRQRDFLVFDGLGSLVWIGSLMAAGRWLGATINAVPTLLDPIEHAAGLLLLLGVVGFLGVRIYRRQSQRKRLAEARLEPADLKALLDRGEPVYIVDLRHPLERRSDPVTLPGALHFLPDALAGRHAEIPRDRDVVLFCACPNEASAATTARTLDQLGIRRARPLRGGLDEWRRLGYPVDALETVAA
jgi:membrane protein DedA with SNARE-associated domain/rhodanese-related sulfurtransferase